MSKRSLKDFKDDPTIKTPHIAWLFEQKVVYVAILTIFVAFVGSFLWKGYGSLQRISAEPVKDSPYSNVSAKDSPGMAWAKTLADKKPSGVKEWKVSDVKKPRHLFSSCSAQGEVPVSLLGAYGASGDSVEMIVQVYGAGQAAAQFSAYAKAYEKCFTNVSDESKDSTKIMKFDNGFAMSMGDAIIGVKAPDNGSRDNLMAFYEKEMKESLIDSNCLALSENEGDSTRSFYFNKDSYTGLLNTTTIKTNVDYSGLPVPQQVQLATIEDNSVSQPEAPLPKDFPTLPEAVEQPTIPNPVSDDVNFDQNAKYQVKDEDGAGCGWAWSGQMAPVYDEDKLAGDKKKSLSEAQEKADDAAESYLQQKRDWSYAMAMTLPKADKWNAYVKGVNTVHERWTWLNTERGKIEDAWSKYVNDHDDWLTFDDRKKSASDSYDKALKECKAKQDELSEWEKQYGDKEGDPGDNVIPTPSPSPSPSPSATETIPPKPEGCGTIPTRPAILDQQRGNEPAAPTIPDGVTIPDSWPKPKTD